MRVLEVYINKILAGRLSELNTNNYIFKYDDKYFIDPSRPSISLTMPKKQQEYRSTFLFPVFFNILSEGVNKQIQCKQLKIDEDDNFGLLEAMATSDVIGAISIKPLLTE
jgi:serine/threonine-protein kinase HipA